MQPKDEYWARLALGDSGDVEVELAFLAAMEEGFRVFCAKQRDYGRKNIVRLGEQGVATRLCEKSDRLEHLTLKDHAPSNESLRDSWVDIGNYGFIGLMCHTGTWPQPK